MKTYRVGVVLEQGGYTEIQANSETEAEEKLLAMVEEEGESAIEDVTHRDFWCISDTEEV